MEIKRNSIKDWSQDDRPREKAIAYGFESVSTSELLAILLHHGTREKSAVDLGKEILALCNNNLNELAKISVKDLMKLKGIGEAKAITICTAIELGRRRQAEEILEKKTFKSSIEIAKFLQVKYKDYSHEVFAVLYLNQANKLLQLETLSEGGLTGTVVDVRLLIKKALEIDAVNLVVCHNHPSGNLQPSRADNELTQTIQEASRFFNLKLLDHIIVSQNGYYSYSDNDKI